MRDEDRRRSGRRPFSARLEDNRRSRRFATREDVEAFFRACDSGGGPETEPDWHDHLGVIAASRAGGASGA